MQITGIRLTLSYSLEEVNEQIAMHNAAINAHQALAAAHQAAVARLNDAVAPQLRPAPPSTDEHPQG